jgi:hypothetical protein
MTNQSMNSIGGWYGVPGHDANPGFRTPQASTGSNATVLCPAATTLAVRYEATVHIAAINEWLRPDR